MHLRHLLVEEGSAASALALASWCPSFSSARSPPSRFPHHLWRLYTADFERSCPNLICIHLYIYLKQFQARAPLSVINTMSISFGILASYVFIFAFPAFYLVFFASGLSLAFLLLSPFLPESPHFLVAQWFFMEEFIIFSLSLFPCKSQRNFCHFQSLMNI